MNRSVIDSGDIRTKPTEQKGFARAKTSTEVEALTYGDRDILPGIFMKIFV